MGGDKDVQILASEASLPGLEKLERFRARYDTIAGLQSQQEVVWFAKPPAKELVYIPLSRGVSFNGAKHRPAQRPKDEDEIDR